MGCTFSEVIRLGFFKLTFDEMLKGNNSVQRNASARALLLDPAGQSREQEGRTVWVGHRQGEWWEGRTGDGELQASQVLWTEGWIMVSSLSILRRHCRILSKGVTWFLKDVCRSWGWQRWREQAKKLRNSCRNPGEKPWGVGTPAAAGARLRSTGSAGILKVESNGFKRIGCWLEERKANSKGSKQGALKRKGIRTYATTWMNITLREISHHKKTNCMTPITGGPTGAKFRETKGRTVVAAAQGGEHWEVLLRGYWVSVWQDEEF